VKTRSYYDAAIEPIGSVINAWDPYSLHTGGAPRDEFEPEIARLVARIPRIHSLGDAAREISVVSSATFKQQRFTVGVCADVGAKLYERPQNAGLLSTRGA